MSAFGRLLIHHFGGNLDAYEGNTATSKPPKPITKKQQLAEDTENDEWVLANIIQNMESLVERIDIAGKHISNDVEMKSAFKTEKVFNKFHKWRSKFIDGLVPKK
jgi:hypothetical protein